MRFFGSVIRLVIRKVLRKGEFQGTATRLEDLYNRTEGHDWHWWFRPEVSAHAPYRRLMHVIDPSTQDDRQAARERWQQIVGEDQFRTNDPDFVQAFAEGALELWDEVKDQL